MKPLLEMKFVFCVTLSLILCNFNVDSGAIGVVKELGKDCIHGAIDYAKLSIEKRIQGDPLLSSVARFFGRDPSQWNIGSKTKLTDLNVDCLYLILEHLDFDNLLNVAQINRPFSTLASAVFRSKYSHLKIIIYDTYLHHKDESDDLLNVFGVRIHADTIVRIFQRVGILEKEHKRTSYVPIKYILIEDYDVLQNTFKHFGHVIKKLKWVSHIYFEYTHSIELGNWIGNYSSESLVDIEFGDWPSKTLEYIKRPLINVENVTFTSSFYGVTSETLPINELFPRLRRLNLDFTCGTGLNYFDCYMPHLEHVFIRGLKNFYSYDGANDKYSTPFENIIMKNPQIRSINLNNPHPDFLHKISEFMPQLEHLTLSHFELEDVFIEFENVTTFFADFGNSSPESLHFPRLQTLHIDFNWYLLFDEWVNFVNEHKQLNQLQLKHYDFDDLQFKRITENLTNLVKMTLWARYDVHQRYKTLSTDCIVEFVKSHEQLKELNIINYPEQFGEELQYQLEEEWDVKILDRSLSLERKMFKVIVDK